MLWFLQDFSIIIDVLRPAFAIWYLYIYFRYLLAICEIPQERPEVKDDEKSSLHQLC